VVFCFGETIPLLLGVHPPAHPWVFSILFGFAMGADYMLIPLMAAEQFGVNSLPRAMAIILPANTIAQTGFPVIITFLQEYFGRFNTPMYVVFAVGLLSSISIALLPRKEKEEVTGPDILSSLFTESPRSSSFHRSAPNVKYSVVTPRSSSIVRVLSWMRRRRRMRSRGVLSGSCLLSTVSVLFVSRHSKG
jgi:MFS family permease